MKFYLFHLMPYADLDLTFQEKHETSWVKLPNSYYDPEKGSLLYNRYIDELVRAEELGFDGICVNEHHQTAYGMMPTPGVIAGALARETERVNIAVLGRALPLLNNPLLVAEEYAMLDNISRGRLIAGFVRGIGAEYHSWGVSPSESHERFHEAHDLIVRAWTETGPFPYEGDHYRFNYVNTWPRPLQKPHPPIWIPSQGSQETIEWAAHPDRKYAYLMTFSPAATVKKSLDRYREAAEGYGYTATSDQLGWSIPIYVSDTDEKAVKEARPHIENLRNKFLKMPFEYLIPPGYTSPSSYKRMAEAKATIFAEITIEKLLEMGMFICGSPATVRDQLSTYEKDLGFSLLPCLLQFGTLDRELTAQNMELFAKKVIPYLR